MSVIRQIRTHEQIKKHLALLYYFQPAMGLYLDAQTSLSVSRFIYNPDQKKEIVLKTTTTERPKGSSVTVRYMLEGSIYYFKSELKTFTPFSHYGAFYKIGSPQSVRAINRRNFLRLQPSDHAPVMVTLNLPGIGPISEPVKDLSAGGISLLIPQKYGITSIEAELDIILHLPDRSPLSTTAVVKNKAQSSEGLRLGVEFYQMSDDNQKKLTDYIVSYTLSAKHREESQNTSEIPTIYLIQDNKKMEESLSYLKQPYRLLCQDIKEEWKSIGNASPDILLFNLETIPANSLISKIQSLSNWRTPPPAIVISQDESLEIECDATILSQFKDPAMLIEAVEQARNLQNISKKDIKKTIFKLPTAHQTAKKVILVLDLLQNFSKDVVNEMESKQFAVKVLPHLQGILDVIKKFKPKLIVINVDVELSLDGFFRMVKINKLAQSIPFAILLDDISKKTNQLQKKYNLDISFHSTHFPPKDLADQLTLKIL
jgi:c-di-GMP-binding flagellar brake protein YcgR